jgi:O-Antigen ligase
VADLTWLLVTSDLPMGAILAGFNKYFLFFAAIPAAALLRPLMSGRQMTIRFTLLLLPLVAVAMVQYALNDPLLPIASEDGTYEIPAIDFYGQIRAFSLYRSVLECGQGMAFFGALASAQLLASRRYAAWNLLLLALAVAACFATFRRGAYMEFSAAAIAAVAITRRWALSRWLPWVYLAVGVALAGGGTLLSSVDGESIMSWESLAERHDAWTMVLERWLLREDASLLFGTGLAQIESDEIDYFLVDNGFLAVGAQLGIVGLGLWCWVMHALWRDMLATAWRTRDSLAIAVASLLSTWMMRAVFDPLFALYPLYVFLVFWTERGAPLATRSSLKATRVATARPKPFALGTLGGA